VVGTVNFNHVGSVSTIQTMTRTAFQTTKKPV